MQFAANRPVDDLLQEEDIHETLRQPLTAVFPTLVVCALMALGHALNLYISVFRNDSLGLFVVIHLVLTAVVFAYAKMLEKADKDPRFAYLLLVMSFVIGPFGAIGTFMSGVFALIFTRGSLPFSEWFASIFPSRDVSRVEQLYDDIILGRDEYGKDYNVMPFYDVMLVGSDAQKRVALSRMTANFRPEFAPAFKRALQDGSPTVRVHAATAIVKIENAFYDRLVKLQTLVEHFPKKPEVKKALAQHYDDYAFTGLLDPYREQQNRERARAAYLEYLALVPSDVGVRQNIGRLFVRGDRPREAAEWFKACLDEGYNTDTIKLWYFECLFNVGEYARLRDAVFSMPVDATLAAREKPQLAEALALWSGGRQLMAPQAA